MNGQGGNKHCLRIILLILTWGAKTFFEKEGDKEHGGVDFKIQG